MIVRFRDAMLSGDRARIAETLAVDVAFHSPAGGEPTCGRQAVAGVLATAAGVYESLSFTDLIQGEERTALCFQAHVAGQAIEDCYLVHLDDDGLVLRLH